MDNEKVYTADNLPSDAIIFNKEQEYAPIDPGEIYQAEVTKGELKNNNFYKSDEKDPNKRGQKYVFNFEFTILNEGEFYGRKVWDTASLAMKPTGKRGATKLYKICTNAMATELDWDGCEDFAKDIQTLHKNIQEFVVEHQVRIGIENSKNPETGKIRTKITTYSPIKKELPKFVPPEEVPVEEVPHPAETAKE